MNTMTHDEAVRVLAALGNLCLSRRLTPQECVQHYDATNALTSPPAVPDGFVVVPREPTVDMVNAGVCGCMDNDVTVCVYRAMLAAAPPSEPPSGGKAAELAEIRAAVSFAAGNPSPAEQGAREGGEAKLTDAGVYKGAHGLRGLLNARDFWDRQPYGTRLYYGNGGADYLHIGVLRAAVELLDKPAAAPLAAGHVGVGKSIGVLTEVVAQFKAMHGPFDHDYIKDEKCCARCKLLKRADTAIESLAGPLVAGEVEAKATQAFARDVQQRLLECDEAMPRRTGGRRLLIDAYNAIGELLSMVYADTAKGNGNG